jgi:hypothetical protein
MKYIYNYGQDVGRKILYFYDKIKQFDELAYNTILKTSFIKCEAYNTILKTSFMKCEAYNTILKTSFSKWEAYNTILKTSLIKCEAYNIILKASFTKWEAPKLKFVINSIFISNTYPK